LYIISLAAQIAAQRLRGRQVVLVTSGAIRAGMGQLGQTAAPRTIPEKQAAASVGQCALMSLYADIFQNYGIVVGQVLQTGRGRLEVDDVRDRVGQRQRAADEREPARDPRRRDQREHAERERQPEHDRQVQRHALSRK
jgi:hypothetical protein